MDSLLVGSLVVSIKNVSFRNSFGAQETASPPRLLDFRAPKGFRKRRPVGNVMAKIYAFVASMCLVTCRFN